MKKIIFNNYPTADDLNSLDDTQLMIIRINNNDPESSISKECVNKLKTRIGLKDDEDFPQNKCLIIFDGFSKDVRIFQTRVFTMLEKMPQFKQLLE